MTKKSDDKSSKKGAVSSNLSVSKDTTTIKSTNTKENRAGNNTQVIDLTNLFFSRKFKS
jgi:hypothetical protein